MKFRFNLETVLNWKRGLEEQSRILLVRKIEELKKQEARIQSLIRKRIDKYREFKERLQKGMDSNEYIIFQQFSEQSYEDLLKLMKSKNHQENEVDKERKNLTEIIKERKILERLKEKRLKRFIYQEEKYEQKLLDEFVIREKSHR